MSGMEKARSKVWLIAIAIAAFIPGLAVCVGMLLYRSQGQVPEEIWQILFVAVFTVLPFLVPLYFVRKANVKSPAADETTLR